MTKKLKTIVYVLWEGIDGIFLSADQYDHDSKVQFALENAKTWAEFRGLLPEGEFEQLPQWWRNDGDKIFEENGAYSMIAESELPKFWDSAGEKFVIRASAKFDCMDVWGVGDGDYPVWQMNTCDEQLPPEFVEKYGNPVRSMVAGAWTGYPQDKLSEMTEFLADYGYRVLKNLDMNPTKPLSELE